MAWRRFSQRIGKAPIPNTIQLADTMTEGLRNGLWSVLHTYIFSGVPQLIHPLEDLDRPSYPFHSIFARLWLMFFKEPTDTISLDGNEMVATVRGRFFSATPMEAYDFLDFMIHVAHELGVPGPFADGTPVGDPEQLCEALNTVLRVELCGYRVVAGRLAPITSDIELAELGNAATAVDEADAFRAAREHLRTALSLYADRSTPDYRNAIKESICAVESVVRVLTNKPKLELGSALDELEKTMPLHRALRKGLKAIYGYTSDEGGIRHAMIDDPKCDADDARYMLVMCSAFVNFLIAKAAAAKRA